MTIIKDLMYVLAIFIAVWVAFYLIEKNYTLAERMVRYDCRLAEISPDYPTDVRDECRRRRIELMNRIDNMNPRKDQ